MSADAIAETEAITPWLQPAKRDVLRLLTNIVDDLDPYRKLYFVLTGGGIELADIAKIPGASKCLYGIEIPYHKELTASRFSSVSAEQCMFLAERLLSSGKVPANVDVIIVTAALTTNRYRKGDTHAYVYINGKIWHIQLPKLSEQDHKFASIFHGIQNIRMIEDNILSYRVAELIDEHLVVRGV
jgi:hypothetical protein